MPFTLHISNDLTAMMARLTADMHEHGQKLGPMQSQFIVTQTEGMNLWVRQNLAAGNGIVANVKFLQPMDLVSRLQFYAASSPQSAEPLSADQWCWMIYGVLGEPEFCRRFPMVRAYCSEDDLRRVALAWRLADLFDQYQIYRSDTIREWNRLSVDQLSVTDDWQAVLWRRVKSLCADGTRDRVEAADELMRSLGEVDISERVRNRFPHLYIFGLAVITPFFEQIFEKLSGLVNLHLYQVNPSPREYWLDDTSERRLARLLSRKLSDHASRPLGNDLLINWGTVVRDSFSLLFAKEELINSADDSLCVPACTLPGDPGSLLKKIQAAVYHNIPVSRIRSESLIPFNRSDIKDGSIVLKGCFTPAREVEVLYNYLVGLLAETGGLAARDILVMATDIGKYAPYIKATFDHGPVKIPYAISDVPLGSGDNMFTALAGILDFDGAAFRAEDIMNLLEFSYVRDRFGIEDVGRLRRSVLDAGIRYGLRRMPDHNEEAHPFSWFSWHHGLKRMVYGLTMIVPEGYVFNDGEDEVLPIDSSEGMSGNDRIRLAYFLRVLEQSIIGRSTDRTLGEWADYLKSTMEDLVFSAAEREDDDYQRFIKILEDLAAWENPTGLKIPFRVFRHHFKDRLRAEQRSGQFVSKGITFCSPVPMRSIPHRVVAMLGMDFDAFPRDEQSVNFSLMATFRPGDRNIRKNDNHLFLETLLSAREKFYISYQARSVKDGSELPPSALVDELIDFVARASDADTDKLREEWVEVHPLHPFSNRYDGISLRNYLRPDRFFTGIGLGEPVEDGFVPPGVISPGDLSKFLENPARHFLTKRFQVYYREDETVIPDHEPFEIDTLSGGMVKKFLLRNSDPIKVEEWRLIQARNGQIPAGNLGIASLEHLKEKVADAQAAYVECTNKLTQLDKYEVVITTAGITVQGGVSDMYSDKDGNLILVRVATSSKLRNALEAFVDYVLLTASGRNVTLKFISPKGNITMVSADALQPENAAEVLDGWIKSFSAAYKGFIPAYLHLIDPVLKSPEQKSVAERVMKAIKKVDKGLDGYPFNDSYFQRAWQDGTITDAAPEDVEECHKVLYGAFYGKMPDALNDNK